MNWRLVFVIAFTGGAIGGCAASFSARPDIAPPASMAADAPGRLAPNQYAPAPNHYFGTGGP